MDDNKWIDNVLCLNESAKNILLAFHAIRQLLDKSAQVEKELIINNIIFKPIKIQQLKCPDIQGLIESNLASSRKSIIKSFPNSSIRVIPNPHYDQKLESIYDALCHTVVFLEYSNICIQQSLKFIKLSVIILL